MGLRQQRGITLMEQVVVIFIIGVLASIGWTAYDKQRTKANRADAIAALLKVADQMERCYQTTIPNSYNDCLLPADGNGILCFVVINISCPQQATMVQTKKGYYNISIASQSQDNYTLQATPVANGPQDGDASLTLDAKGNKTGPWPN